MKSLLVIFSLMSFTSAWASKGSEIIRKYAESDLVLNLVHNVEAEYGVTCHKSHQGGILPTVFGSVWYSTHCEKLGTIIKLKINSTFKNVDQPDFVFEKYKVKVLLGDLLSGSDEIFYQAEEELKSRDPFVNAFKKSELVRSVRHFIEDQNKVVCDEGKAHKKNANYFYKVDCKSDTVSLTLKVKAKVHVVGDDRFKFKLTRYKVLF